MSDTNKICPHSGRVIIYSNEVGVIPSKAFEFLIIRLCEAYTGFITNEYTTAYWWDESCGELRFRLDDGKQGEVSFAFNPSEEDYALAYPRLQDAADRDDWEIARKAAEEVSLLDLEGNPPIYTLPTEVGYVCDNCGTSYPGGPVDDEGFPSCCKSPRLVLEGWE